MAVWLTVSYTIKIQAEDEKAFRANAVGHLCRADRSHGPECIQSAITEARSGGWDFVQELLLVQSVLPHLAGVIGSEETIYKPSVGNARQ